MLTHEQFEKLVQHLEGSSGTLENALEELFNIEWQDLSDEDHSRLDNVIFSCESCGWWCEVACMSDDGEWICEDCE